MEQVIKNIVFKEEETGIYDIRIGDIPIYDYVRQFVRREYLLKNGVKSMELLAPVVYSDALKSILISMIRLSGMYLSGKKYSNIFFAFSRLDMISGKYCDKFTDPYIDCSDVGTDYIIFENGRSGKHLKPRTHNKNVVYTDWITFWSRVSAWFLYPLYRIYYNVEFDSLNNCLAAIFGDDIADNKLIVRKVITGLRTSHIYVKLFKRIGAKRIIAPARPVNQFIAAHKSGMECFEVQHGITYGETVLYSGGNDELARPDKFLAFGRNKPDDVYGIDPDNMVVIGWPLPDYLEKVSSVQYDKDDFLVISEPEVSDAIIDAVLYLAEKYPDSNFYIRPHPLEGYDKSQRNRIASLPNVLLQNNHINIFESMMGFENVLGENSSVLYEALSIGKKVGKLFFTGLSPIYLQPEDVSSFWEIRQASDLSSMLVGKSCDKVSKSIYSSFDKVEFSKILID